jgi:hypothetical protein
MTSNCHNLLLSSLTTYYKKNPKSRQALREVIESNSILSLRVIDWFVTHYARTNQVIYWIDVEKGIYYEKYPESNVNPNIRKFHLYMEYRAQLQSYTKLFFDPFRRHERITFVLEDKPLVSVETTVGQLNFFRWIFQNHIYSYILANLQHIENTMAKYQKQLKTSKSTPSPVVAGTAATTTTTTSINTSAIANNDHKLQSLLKSKNTATKKKDTHIGNIVLRTPCFIRFD